MLKMPTFQRLPCPIYFRNGTLPAAAWHAHAHPWGQFNYVARGVMQLTVDKEILVSPPQYAVWIPPGVVHASSHGATLEYRSVYLAPRYCRGLPTIACAVTVSDLLKALLEEVAVARVAEPDTPELRRIAMVVVDQIRGMRPVSNFLPMTKVPALRAAMTFTEEQLADAKPIRDIARAHHMSLRTLERLAVKHLGMSFGDWRERLRFLKATEALLQGTSIDRVASAVGYASASSFIEMFKRHAGMTPDRYRRDKLP